MDSDGCGREDNGVPGCIQNGHKEYDRCQMDTDACGIGTILDKRVCSSSTRWGPSHGQPASKCQPCPSYARLARAAYRLVSQRAKRREVAHMMEAASAGWAQAQPPHRENMVPAPTGHAYHFALWWIKASTQPCHIHDD